MNFDYRVALDDSNKICYFGGESISGSVYLRTYEEKQIQSLYVFLEGVELVDWQDITSEIRHGFIAYDVQRYRDQILNSFDFQILDKNIILPVGSLVYNFSLTVPTIAQPTCIVKQGHIKYRIRVHLVGEKCSHILCKIPVMINQYLTSEMALDLLRPVEMRYVDSYWWWPFQSNPATITLHLPLTLYAPGESMNFTLILNNTNRFSDIQRISMILLQKQQHTSSKPERRHHINYVGVCSTMYERPCASMTNHTLRGELPLPDSLPSSTEITSKSLNEDSLISITYILRMIITMGGFSFDGSFSIPITIGHYDKCQLTLKQISSETKHMIIAEDRINGSYV